MPYITQLENAPKWRKQTLRRNLPLTKLSYLTLFPSLIFPDLNIVPINKILRFFYYSIIINLDIHVQILFKKCYEYLIVAVKVTYIICFVPRYLIRSFYRMSSIRTKRMYIIRKRIEKIKEKICTWMYYPYLCLVLEENLYITHVMM